jgi:hypothetical protein
MFVMFLMSCSVLDYPIRILGISINKFKTEQVEKASKIFEMSKKDCFRKSLIVIKDLEAKVAHKNFGKGYIVAFSFTKSFSYCLASTEVVIFISNFGGNSIKVEIISGNSLLAKELSIRFFEMLRS